MTDSPETNDAIEPNAIPETPEVIPVPRRRSPIRRLGCIIALVIWFLILLAPCFLIVLAVQQEISISTGSAPGQQTRLWLISEAEQRGLAISTASTHQATATGVCVETDVRFLLWTGQSDPLSYCDCYQRENVDAPWSQTTTAPGVCTG